jgi:sulfite exporter TauE/SafE/copper chaperone CopZ
MKKKKKPENKTVKNCTLYVEGMHCASCEVLIEKKILKQKGIETVDASLKGNKVQINYVGDYKPSLNSLNKEFSNLGYRFSNKKRNKKESPLVTFKNGSLFFNPKKILDLLKTIGIVIILIGVFFAFENLQLGQYVSVDSSSSLPAFFALGLVAGLSSCAALIGGLLLSMTKQWNEIYIDEESMSKKAQPHVMFHIGRIISFSILGGFLGLAGEIVNLNNPTFFGLLTILISIIMFILALQMLGVAWAQRIKFAVPSRFVKFAANEENFNGRSMPLALGMFTFILPCGFTLIAQSIALASGSPIQGALIMLFFALGTLPTLIGISISGFAFNSKPALTARFNIIAGFVIVFFVIYNVNGQFNVLGLPSLSDVSFSKEIKDETAALDSNGVQVLNFVAEGFEYIPQGTTTIKAGIPTRLVVNNKGIVGCGTFMAARGLINNFVALEKGRNTIEIPDPQKGSYKLTCTMGMVPPVTIIVI